MVIATPEYGNGRSSPRARPWSEQSPWSELSPSERMVWAVPEHKSGLGSARAQKVVWAVPEHSSGQGKSTVTCAACTIIWCIYFSLFSAKSSLTRLVKKANRYSTSFCLLIFSGKQSVDTCIEVCQCGPSYTINEEARTLLTKERVYWRRSRGGVNNRPPCVRTSPKKLGRTKRRYSLLFII